MLSLANRAAVASALNDPDLDPDLRALIGRRVRQLYIDQNRPPGGDIKFVVVEGGDTPEVINQALGFAITGNYAEQPRYEWIEDHGLWFEIAYVRGPNLRAFIYVENGPGTELGIHHLCLSHFWPDDEGGR